MCEEVSSNISEAGYDFERKGKLKEDFLLGICYFNGIFVY